MTPPNLQGLNVVLPHPSAADSHDLIGQPYPDLSAQLDLWTNLAFDSDESPINSRTDGDNRGRKSLDDDDDDPPSPTLAAGEAAIHDGHINVVTGTSLGTNQPSSIPIAQNAQQQHQHQPLDLSTFLAGFGIDPFAVPQQQQHQQSAAAIGPSLAQLLALQPPNFALPHQLAHTALPTPVHQQQQPLTVTETTAQGDNHASDAEEGYPPVKRPRTRKTSEQLATASADGTLTGEQTASLAAEDKRRRNTAASARFRLKKKEREAALEGKAKELELRVSELERECEGLRRENGWLKGLVVGVTGAAQAPTVVGAAPITATTMKRPRDEVGGA
ncbi:hypothetical protein AX17_005733 [Amanita inopinata Kibby_2008]|nr:hypothetical protein AX17_005733 [Amanita inopinata Kibby_2008]